MKSNTYKCTNAHAIKQTKELNLSFQVTEFGEELIQDDTIGLKTFCFIPDCKLPEKKIYF